MDHVPAAARNSKSPFELIFAAFGCGRRPGARRAQTHGISRRYDAWGAYLPEAPEGYELSIGAENFLEILRRYGGPTAVDDWNKLAATLRPLASGVMGLPSTAVLSAAWIFRRGDAAAAT